MVHLKIFSMLPFPGFQANLVTIKIFGSQNFLFGEKLVWCALSYRSHEQLFGFQST